MESNRIREKTVRYPHGGGNTKAKEWYAHITEDGRRQTVKEHLEGTASLCEAFAAAFGGEQQGRYLGMMHDIGKYSEAFQKRLFGGPKVDHSTAGAYEAAKAQNIPAAFCVAGHHAGLPDGGGQTDIVGTTLLARLNGAAKGALPAYHSWAEEIQPPEFNIPALKDSAEASFYIRMLYSCLVDADFLDTERFMDGEERAPVRFDAETLLRRLNAYIAPWFPPEKEINVKRCRILEACIQHGKLEKGLFSLTVPTGGGKTIASLAFALNHAKSHGMRRIIYVIPYTSIIEQTAGIFAQVLGKDAVLEHHAAVVQEPDGDDFDLARVKATENWDAPIVVTTAVQFFESLYASKSSKCRKLHNIANSVIIFDEAQMLPVPYLRPCVLAISELVKSYGASAVLCTATQPALNGIFHEFIPGCRIRELCPDELFEDSVFRRVRFVQGGELSCDELAQAMRGFDQVLCIVNSRKTAQEIFENLPVGGRYHLSTLMYPAHRKTVLAEIRERLARGEVCRVVATSLIEAGVDVDFPKVFREEAGLDSVIQAAGRCNREGKRAADDSVVTVFKSGKSIPPAFDVPVNAGRASMKRYDDPSSKAAIEMYFKELLSLKGTAALDKKSIIPQLKNNNFPFKTVAEQFKLIESDSRTIYIAVDEAQPLVARLRRGERSRELYRALAQYGVTVYENHFRALELAGATETLNDGSIVFTNISLYSANTGLTLDADSGQALFI